MELSPSTSHCAPSGTRETTAGAVRARAQKDVPERHVAHRLGAELDPAGPEGDNREREYTHLAARLIQRQPDRITQARHHILYVAAVQTGSLNLAGTASPQRHT